MCTVVSLLISSFALWGCLGTFGSVRRCHDRCPCEVDCLFHRWTSCLLGFSGGSHVTLSGGLSDILLSLLSREDSRRVWCHRLAAVYAYKRGLLLRGGCCLASSIASSPYCPIYPSLSTPIFCPCGAGGRRTAKETKQRRRATATSNAQRPRHNWHKIRVGRLAVEQ